MSNPQSSAPGQPDGAPSLDGPRILAIVLAIIGILAAILGVLYIVAGTSLPDTLQGSVHHGHHAYRAAAAFVVAVACLAGAWLASRRRPAAGGG